MQLIRVGVRVFKFPGVDFYAVGCDGGWDLMQLCRDGTKLWTPWPLSTRAKVIEFYKAMRELESRIKKQKERKP